MSGLRDMIRASVLASVLAAALGSACTPSEAPGAPSREEARLPLAPLLARNSPESAPLGTALDAPSGSETAAPSDAANPRRNPPANDKNFELPPGLIYSRVVDIDVPGDLRARVRHARAPLERAIVYLHGMCSSSTPADAWSELATRYGTLVMLRAETPCGDRPGNKWTKDPAILQARIDRALEAVRAARGGHLDTAKLSLIGYSQGAHRAELLTATYPERYREVVLGGPPEAALPEHFRSVRRLAVMGGELENTDHMRQGADQVRRSGVLTRFFLLPKAYHGDYGPRGPEVMAEVLSWLYGQWD